tara:strand:+ start:196 stop:300 length:105 start_codon:yes stop_codon:yes gene_type:complete
MSYRENIIEKQIGYSNDELVELVKEIYPELLNDT